MEQSYQKAEFSQQLFGSDVQNDQRMTDDVGPTILIVDDDPQVLHLFERILKPDYTVESADSGEAALEAIGSHIDACLIDRRMPSMSGGEVVKRIREEGYDLPIAMVTAVDPDFDVLELGFDDYVVKPVAADELRSVVQSLLLRREYDVILRDFFSLASKITAIKSSKSPEELVSNGKYGQVVDDLNEIKEEAKKSLDAAIDAGVIEDLIWESFLEGSESELTAADE